MFDGAFDFDVDSTGRTAADPLNRSPQAETAVWSDGVRRRSRSAALPGALRLDGWTTVRALRFAPA